MELFVSCLISFLSLFTSSPPLPITIPGLAVYIVTVTVLEVLLISILEIPPLGNLARRYFLILTSSSSPLANDSPANQVDFQFLFIWSLKPTGCVFCPNYYPLI